MDTISARSEVRDVALYVDGKTVNALGGRTYEIENPFSLDATARVADAERADVDLAVRAARRALEGPWAQSTPTSRGRLLFRLAELIEQNTDELATLETLENGKLYREMRGQMQSLPSWFRYYGGLADKITGDVIPIDRSDFHVYTQSVPVGVVAAITPWNSPLLLLTWKLAPAIAAGCTVVVKPSDFTPSSTIRLAELATEAGIPDGVINVVTGSGPEVGQALTTHPGVDKIAFTGSTEVGRAVAHAAAERFARVTLELGGKSAQIVFPDANQESVANGVIAGIFAATGQTCMAGSRLLVHEDVADELVERVVARARRIVLGDPFDPATEMGPMSNRRQYEKVLEHLGWAREDGSTVATGGDAATDLGGLFVHPTVLTNVDERARSLNQEIFGPVLSVVTFRDEDEAIRIANGTEFGLAGSVWTRDIGRGHRVAGRIKAGTVWVNAYRTIAPQVPFGGFGSSGTGRENGSEAIASYSERKAIWVQLTDSTRDPFTLG